MQLQTPLASTCPRVQILRLTRRPHVTTQFIHSDNKSWQTECVIRTKHVCIWTLVQIDKPVPVTRRNQRSIWSRKLFARGLTTIRWLEGSQNKSVYLPSLFVVHLQLQFDHSRWDKMAKPVVYLSVHTTSLTLVLYSHLSYCWLRRGKLFDKFLRSLCSHPQLHIFASYGRQNKSNSIAKSASSMNTVTLVTNDHTYDS